MAKRKLRKVSDIGGTLHIDTYLTGFSEAYVQEPSMFISPRCVTNIPVSKESNKYATYPRGYFWRDEAEVRPLGGRPKQVGYKVLPKTYLAEEWALETTIDDRERVNIDAPISPDEEATILLEQKQLIRSDRIWVQKFFTAGVWARQAAGSADFTQFNDANSTPIRVIDDYKMVIAKQTGFMPNVLVIGADVWTTLRSHADIADRIKYTGIGVADQAKLAELFGLDRVAVALSVYNTENENVEPINVATATEREIDEAGGLNMQFIADPTAMLLAYVAPTGGLKTPTAMARFSWTGLIPGAGNQFGGVVERGRDSRAHSDWVQNRSAYDMRQVSTDLAVFFRDVVDAISQ